MSTKHHPPALWARALLDLALFAVPRTDRGDRLCARLRFYVHHRRWPGDAMRFNDALHRHSMSPEFRSPLVALTTDKAGAKTFHRLVVGPEHVIPTHAVLRTPGEIWRYDFPDRCVIKGTMGSGQVVFKEPGDRVDRRLLTRWLKRTHYDCLRERNYKGFPNAIIVEEHVAAGEPIEDYKMHCRGGTVRWIYQNLKRPEGQTRMMWDRDWRPLPVGFKHELPDLALPTPARARDMVAAAEKVAVHFDMVRVDLYGVGDHFWMSEITHLESGAEASFVPLVEGERTINRLMFGEEAFAGPYEEHGALGANGPSAR